MIRLLCVFFVLVSALTTGAFASPTGKLETHRFKSAALGGTRSYLVWLPPGYRDSESAYPLVILLHGLGGEGRDWFDPKLGDLRTTLDALVGSGRIKPFIAIAPDGGNGYWTDHLGYPTEPRHSGYGTFIEEAANDAQNRLRADGRRAIVGVSMGGHGALSAALQRPERYVAVVSIAGALFPEAPTHRPIYKKVWGDPANATHWRQTAPMALLADIDPQQAPAIWLHCGLDDIERFLGLTRGAAGLLTERGITHELVTTPGGHDWTTWRQVSEQWLRWLDALIAR